MGNLTNFDDTVGAREVRGIELVTSNGLALLVCNDVRRDMSSTLPEPVFNMLIMCRVRRKSNKEYNIDVLLRMQ